MGENIGNKIDKNKQEKSDKGYKNVPTNVKYEDETIIMQTDRCSIRNVPFLKKTINSQRDRAKEEVVLLLDELKDNHFFYYHDNRYDDM